MYTEEEGAMHLVRTIVEIIMAMLEGLLGDE